MRCTLPHSVTVGAQGALAEPLFGLEHGLIQAEVRRARKRTVRAHIAHRRPSQNHWLAWIVYSAELGYRYSGDEYWQTFEQETPGWLAQWRPLQDSRLLPAVCARVQWCGAIGSLGRTLFHHMLANYTRHPPERTFKYNWHGLSLIPDITAVMNDILRSPEATG